VVAKFVNPLFKKIMMGQIILLNFFKKKKKKVGAKFVGPWAKIAMILLCMYFFLFYDPCLLYLPK
jgi:hypothetical protein